MSIESQLRTALAAYAPLVAVVPPARISIDAAAQGASRPYIAFSKQSETIERGLDGIVHHQQARIDIQCIGKDREQALAVAGLVRVALDAAGQPSDGGGAGYDPDNDIEAEVVTVDWWL